MARKQTRRAVSLRPDSYDQVKAYCAPRGLSMSRFIEDRTADFFSGVERHADDEEPEEEKEPEEPDRKPSGVIKEKPKPYKKPPIRGGGIHEF